MARAKSATAKKTANKKTANTPKTTRRAAPKRQKGQDWYTSGAGGFERKKQIDEVNRIRREKQVQRVYLKPDTEAEILFLDDSGFFINEHALQDWIYITCMKDHDVCPVCDTGKISGYVAYFTVLDLRGYQKRNNTRVPAQKALYGAKGPMIYKIRDLIEKHSGIVGRVFRVKRYTDRESNTGTDIELKSRGIVTPAMIVKKFGKDIAKDLKPFDYPKLFAPPTEDELAALGFAGAAAVGSPADLGKDPVEAFDDSAW